MVGSNWGGTRIEPWTTLDGFKSVPELSEQAKKCCRLHQDTKVGGSTPSAIYNSMVHPLTPYAMTRCHLVSGRIQWGEGITYYQKKHALVKGWRKAFQNPNLGFYWVQLCNWKQPGTTPGGGDGWAKIREAQTQALDLKHTGMAVIIDLADAHNPNDIHPKNKQDVGGRLAQWALHQTYDKKNMVPSGPLYSGHKIKGKSNPPFFQKCREGTNGRKERKTRTDQANQKRYP